VAWQNPATRLLGHGVAGGVSSTLQGGRFGHGFVSAGVTEAAKPGLTRLGEGARRAVAEAIVGGTASAAPGGKFANGAVTAAMSYAMGRTGTSSQTECDSVGCYNVAELQSFVNASPRVSQSGLAGGYSLLGDDMSRQGWVLIRDSKTMTAYYVHTSYAADAAAAVAFDGGLNSGPTADLHEGGGVFLGVVGLSMSYGVTTDLGSGTCAFMEA
jgi:hypothetical protein